MRPVYCWWCAPPPPRVVVVESAGGGGGGVWELPAYAEPWGIAGAPVCTSTAIDSSEVPRRVGPPPRGVPRGVVHDGEHDDDGDAELA